MPCLFAKFAGFFPRIATLLLRPARPALFSAAFLDISHCASAGDEAGIRLGIEGTWGMPVRNAHERAIALADPRLRVCVENVRFGSPRQVVPQHFDVQPAMGRHVESAIRGATPVKEALREMDATVTRILRGN